MVPRRTTLETGRNYGYLEDSCKRRVCDTLMFGRTPLVCGARYLARALSLRRPSRARKNGC
ncbi:hypothetical protein RV134_210127 [Roseovarius sp. EC-HK134]|nr:hypothetical protein RV134_210127 [Roseovarius sp. EC-HK134]